MAATDLGIRSASHRAKLAAGVVFATVSASAVGTAMVVVPAASARPIPAIGVVRPHTAATVVKIDKTEGKFTNVLNTLANFPLYTTATACTGTCLQAWPPLLMPKGTTIPRGAPNLATAKFGTRLQVTYKTHRLYKFVGDTAGHVTGNGVSGFKVVAGV